MRSYFGKCILISGLSFKDCLWFWGTLSKRIRHKKNYWKTYQKESDIIKYLGIKNVHLSKCNQPETYTLKVMMARPLKRWVSGNFIQMIRPISPHSEK